jgi:uncharacterized membrane protein YfhO
MKMENINDYKPNEFVKYILHHLKQYSSVISSCLLLLDEKSLTIDDKANILNLMKLTNDNLKKLENEVSIWVNSN